MSSTTSTKITLFDVATSLPDGEPISPYCSRVRYVLNYKELAFTTVWVPVKDISATCEKHGFKPTGLRPDGSPRYTLPAIIDETNSSQTITMTDSFPIVKYLDETYPDASRPLFPSYSPDRKPAPAIYLIVDAYMKNFHVSHAIPFVVEGIHNIVTPDSRAAWKQSNLGGRNPEDIALKKGTKEYDEALKKLTDALKVIAGFLELNGGAKWLTGDNPTFADFAILSILRVQRLANSTNWGTIKELNGGILGRYLEAGDVYMKWK